MAIPYTFTNGTLANATEVNANFTYAISPSVKEVYTGTGFNNSIAASSNVETSYEMTAQSATDRNYVKVTFTGTADGSIGATGSGQKTIKLKFQIKETGGAYGDAVSYITLVSDANPSNSCSTGGSIVLSYALTAGMKANGYQIKPYCNCITGLSSAAAYTNSKVIVEEVF